MSAQVPVSSLTTDQLLKLALFNRSLADSLDAAFATGGGAGNFTMKLYIANGAEVGTGFTLALDTVQPDTNYHVGFYGVEADIIVPISWAFENKTTTQCTVKFAGDGLSAGGLYLFSITR